MVTKAAGEDDKGKGGANEGENKALEVITKGMADLLGRFEVIETNVTGINKRFDELATPPTEGDAGKPPSDGDDKNKPSLIPDNLETLPRADFLNVIMNQMQEIVKESVKAVNSNVSGMQTKLNARDVQAEVAGLMKVNKDFQDWLPEMKNIAEQNPGLSATRIYALAKVENTEKAKEMKTKYSDPPADTPPKKTFGGLTPTSGGQTSDSDMKPDEAANKAFDEVFGSQTVGESG